MPYDMILKGGYIVDVSSRSISKGDVLIQDGLIVGVKPSNTSYNKNEKIVDITGKYVSPGLIDSHLHIESSMLSPLEFAKKAVEHGTTSIFVDPHEIANVSGKRGIDLFLDQSKLVTLDVYIGIPSCVPATHLEDSGASIVLDDIKELVKHPLIYGLGEMMNTSGIIRGLGDAREKVNFVYDYGKVVDGHFPQGSGDELKSYVTNGKNDDVIRIMSDHESTTPEEAIEKHKAGMYIALRYGSASKDLDRILPELIRKKIRLDRFMLCSDDLDASELYSEGHMDRIIKRVRDIIIKNSKLNLEQATLLALSLATVNPTNYFSRFLSLHGYPEIGQIGIGKKANLVVFNSLEDLGVEKVIYNGKIVVDDGRYIGKERGYDYTDFLKSVNLGKKLSASDFKIKYDGRNKSVKVKVIGATEGNLETKLLEKTFKVSNGELRANPKEDVAKIGVFERHRATGSYSLGFVQGLGIKRGAVASTVAHDSHNLIVVGVNDNEMARAANYLGEKGGGMIVVTGGRVNYFPLGIAGLMSTEPIERVLKQHKKLVNTVKKTGSGLENIFMTLSFLSLPVIPELKITNQGLVDVKKFEIVRLY